MECFQRFAGAWMRKKLSLCSPEAWNVTVQVHVHPLPSGTCFACYFPYWEAFQTFRLSTWARPPLPIPAQHRLIREVGCLACSSASIIITTITILLLYYYFIALLLLYYYSMVSLLLLPYYSILTLLLLYSSYIVISPGLAFSVLQLT